MPLPVHTEFLLDCNCLIANSPPPPQIFLILESRGGDLKFHFTTVSGVDRQNVRASGSLSYLVKEYSVQKQ